VSVEWRSTANPLTIRARESKRYPDGSTSAFENTYVTDTETLRRALIRMRRAGMSYSDLDGRRLATASQVAVDGVSHGWMWPQERRDAFSCPTCTVPLGPWMMSVQRIMLRRETEATEGCPHSAGA
jgi:hypothetical protein